MIELNLIANGKEQELIKEYLQNNVSETLANKINNGVKIIKDNKTLINKKDLDGFMKYACIEAKNQANKGVMSVCIQDNIVFGWSIHYFEEDSIEGTLYNEDGTEYKVVSKPKTTPKTEVKTKEIKKQDNQPSLFDILDNTTQVSELDEIIENEVIEQEVENIPSTIIEVDDQKINTETGEVLTQSEQINPFDDEVITSLFSLFENTMEVK